MATDVGQAKAIAVDFFAQGQRLAIGA